jgi:hypothetical protein
MRSPRIPARKLTSVTSVLMRLRRGERLHLEFANGSTRWWMSGGALVPDKIARIVIADQNVCSEGGALFGATGQSFRWFEFN